MIFSNETPDRSSFLLKVANAFQEHKEAVSRAVPDGMTVSLAPVPAPPPFPFLGFRISVDASFVKGEAGLGVCITGNPASRGEVLSCFISGESEVIGD